MSNVTGEDLNDPTVDPHVATAALREAALGLHEATGHLEQAERVASEAKELRQRNQFASRIAGAYRRVS